MSARQADAPGARRVRAPLRLLLAFGVDRLGQPVLDVARVNDPDVADLARGDHLARLPDHRIAGIVERDREHETGCAGEFDQFLRLGERGRQRLVADDVDARFEECFGDGIVQVVGGHDRHGFDAVRPGRFPRGHLAKVRIDAVGRETEIGAGRAGVLGVGRQRPGLELEQVVEPHRHPVHRADEGVAAAADHADAQALALDGLARCGVDHSL